MHINNREEGVTLLELMVTVAIVAILAAIAYPSYQNQILRSHRAEAKAALLQIQVAQEKYFLQNNSYGTIAQLGAASIGLKPTGMTSNGYYLVSLSTQTTTTFTVKAVPQGGQASDSCGNYGIDQVGNKTPTTTGCW